MRGSNCRPNSTQIKAFAQSVFSSIKIIAVDKITTAANFVEQTLAKAIPIMISFLARLIGLGGIVDKVKKVIARINRPIDQAVDKVIGWSVKMARKVWRSLKACPESLCQNGSNPKTQAERNQQVKEGLVALHREENTVDEDKFSYVQLRLCKISGETRASSAEFEFTAKIRKTG